MSIKEQKAAAKSHLESIGMARYGWLHPELQVAFHRARVKGKITDENLNDLGELFKRTNVERMKPHLMQATAIAIPSGSFPKPTSGKKAFLHLMRTVELAVSPPLENKKLVIKHKDLQPQVKQEVKALLDARKKRTENMIPEKADLLVETAVLLGLGTGFLSNSIAKGVGMGALITIGGLIPGYKVGSPAVLKATKGVVEKGKEIEFLDAQKTISVTHARETHPFLIVDWRGNVHLIPKTKFQNALAKAQRTFLRHVVPGRYRAQL